MNNIGKYEGCFLGALVNSNGFKAFNFCVVEFLNFIGPLAKKLENLLFSEKKLQVDNLLPGVSVCVSAL